MATHPSGQQFTINAGGHCATIVEVGGGVREYTVDGHHVLQLYPIDQMCDGAHGTPLIPWPNRLDDGRYSFRWCRASGGAFGTCQRQCPSWIPPLAVLDGP